MPRLRHARQTFSAVSGIVSLCASPPMALATACTIAASEPVVPASPTPLTPSGLVVAGDGLLISTIGGMSVARGMP